MTLIGARVQHGRITAVGEVKPRTRHGAPANELRPALHPRTPRESLRLLEALLAQATHDSANSNEPPTEADVPATLIEHPALKPQAQLALRLLIERGSLTTLEALDAGAGIRLPARIKEIRKAFGDDGVVETQWERTNGSRYARYVWRGTDEQTALNL